MSWERTKLPKLAVGDKKRSQSPQTFQRLVAVLSRGVPVDRRAGRYGAAAGDLLRLPDEVLQQVAIVLGEEENLGRLNDFLEITNELLAFWGQLLGGGAKHLGCQGTVQRDVDLLVLEIVRETKNARSEARSKHTDGTLPLVKAAGRALVSTRPMKLRNGVGTYQSRCRTAGACC